MKYSKQFKEFKKNNVIKFKEGYATQCGQYNNRLTELELYKYFIKEYYGK